MGPSVQQTRDVEMLGQQNKEWKEGTVSTAPAEMFDDQQILQDGTQFFDMQNKDLGLVIL